MTRSSDLHFGTRLIVHVHRNKGIHRQVRKTQVTTRRTQYTDIMPRLTIHKLLCVVLLLSILQQTLANREVVFAGGEYRHECSLWDDPARYILQFFVDKTEAKMFNGRSFTDDFRLVSNGTDIVPSIADYTDRYSVEVVYGRHTLVIKNVTDSDSAWYGCRRIDLYLNVTSEEQSSTELLVPGPLEGIFWTSNFSGLSRNIARQHEVPDGGISVTDNVWHGPNIACVVLASNVEPVVHITIGRLGEPGSVDITNHFETRSFTMGSTNDGGTQYRETVFFVKRGKFSKSLRDVYCRASLFNTTYEKSVNILVVSKPKKRGCNPAYFSALVGSKNVNLTCLIEAHPKPQAEWILPNGGGRIDALSNNPNYTVTNEARFEGLFTTLTISEVSEEDNMFGRIRINVTNTEGSGEYILYFTEALDDLVGGAGYTRSSAALITMAAWIMAWVLK